MSLTKDDIQKIATLARLQISDSEVPEYQSTLSSILNFVQQLETVETDDVSPMAHPLEMNQRLRDDVVTEADRRAEFQAQAPDTEDGLYLVPKVIE
ncbi:MAG: Asp-tRNA(Asn)/Glu-tRNA(Gln) amidotransferase subunit GatC [Pseudomonadota bacterium]